MLSYFQFLDVLPLWLYAIVITALESILSPIPSDVVFLGIGAAIKDQAVALPNVLLITLAVIITKTVTSVVWFYATKYGSDWVSQSEGEQLQFIQNILAKIETGNKYKKYGWLFVVSAIPVAPSLFVSLMAGLLHVKTVGYLLVSFIGYSLRVGLLIAGGFYGWNLVEQFQIGWYWIVLLLLLVTLPFIFLDVSDD